MFRRSQSELSLILFVYLVANGNEAVGVLNVNSDDGACVYHAHNFCQIAFNIRD